ncbi:MAG: glycoside hydrolase 43 family protein [Oscillospiraceae bacterium]|jgi:beta-xylosidase|nr:glycoside hydrolase 43 family protein [Oscillospiraceae bacterium]
MRYSNPILKGDYSDPDVIRVGDAYYMIASSFTYFPGIPVLRSHDLVHWRLIGHAAASLPFAHYAAPQHKRGLWAPSLRYRQGLFYVYVCTPDEGLFAFTAKDPAGAWDCHHIKDVTGWIDPCPLWDDDGNAYLLHAFAGSRAGIKSVLYLHRMSEEGLSILDAGRMVFDGGQVHETTEGPKFYKRNGYYYIFAPAGGVKTGWQLAMRATNPYGPYEIKTVLAQGDTPVNGPHQGGWVETPSGQGWFIHFQDVGVYGRIPHLQPVRWANDWPVMGDAGQPVSSHEMPDTGRADDAFIATSDAFDGEALGLQWQWQANPNPAWYRLMHPGLRLLAAPAASLFEAGHFLSQLMQSFRFTFDLRLTPHFERHGDRAGLAVMGYRYAYLALEPGRAALYLCEASERGRWMKELVHEKEVASLPTADGETTLRLMIEGGMAHFSVQTAAGFQPIGEAFPLSAGGWTGARPGIFCGNFAGLVSAGYADVSSVTVTDLETIE